LEKLFKKRSKKKSIMCKENGFNPLEMDIPERQSGRLPERHGEEPRFAGNQTDVRKRHRSFLTGQVRKKLSKGQVAYERK